MKKFNALDIFMVLAVFAVCMAVVIYIGGSSNNVVMAKEQKTVFFTVEFSNVPQGYGDKITVGDKIRDSAKDYYYGEVSEIRIEPAKTNVNSLGEGVIKRVEIPEREAVYITIKCNGSESDTEIMAEGQIIKIGKRMTIKGKGYAGAGYITEIITQ